MANTLICPLCRSTLEAHGSIDFNAPALSHPICPVCGYPEDIPSGFPVPHRWDSLSVITRQNPIRTYAQLTQEQPQVAVTTMRLAQDQRSIYSDFNVANALGESAAYVTRSVGAAVGQTVGGAVRGTIEGTTQGLTNGLGLPIILLGGLALVLLLTRK